MWKSSKGRRAQENNGWFAKDEKRIAELDRKLDDAINSSAFQDIKFVFGNLVSNSSEQVELAEKSRVDAGIDFRKEKEKLDNDTKLPELVKYAEQSQKSVDEATQVLESKTSNIADLESREKKLKSRKSALDKVASDLKYAENNARSYKRELDNMEASSVAANKARAEAKKQVEERKAMVASEEKQLSESSDYKTLIQSDEACVSEILKMEAELDDKKNGNHKELKEQIKAKIKEHEEMKSQIAKMEKPREFAKEMYREAEEKLHRSAELARNEQDLLYANVNHAPQKSKLAEVEKEIVTLKEMSKALESVNAELSSLSSRISEASQEKIELENVLNGKRSELGSTKAEISEIQAPFEKARNEYNRAESNLANLSATKSRFEKGLGSIEDYERLVGGIDGAQKGSIPLIKDDIRGFKAGIDIGDEDAFRDSLWSAINQADKELKEIDKKMKSVRKSLRTINAYQGKGERSTSSSALDAFVYWSGQKLGRANLRETRESFIEQSDEVSQELLENIREQSRQILLIRTYADVLKAWHKNGMKSAYEMLDQAITGKYLPKSSPLLRVKPLRREQEEQPAASTQAPASQSAAQIAGKQAITTGLESKLNELKSILEEIKTKDKSKIKRVNVLNLELVLEANHFSDSFDEDKKKAAKEIINNANQMMMAKASELALEYTSVNVLKIMAERAYANVDKLISVDEKEWHTDYSHEFKSVELLLIDYGIGPEEYLRRLINSEVLKSARRSYKSQDTSFGDSAVQLRD